MGTKKRVRFSGTCLKQDKITYNHGKIVSIYIVYEINKKDNTSSDPALENCLFGVASLTKNADIDKYKYPGYEIGFDRHRFFSHPIGGTDRNVIIIGVIQLILLKIISISISSVSIYFNWHLKWKYIETTIYWMQFY